MDLILFWKGFVAGLVVAAPVGPIGIICIQRTLTKGREHGLVSGLGAATADAICGFLATLMFFFFEGFLVRNQLWLQGVGAAFLCFLGYRTFFSHPRHRSTPVNGIGLLRAFTTIFFLALSSPATILPLLGILFSLGVVTHANGSVFHATVLMGGVFFGSASWWLILASTMGWVHAKSDHNVLRWVNRIGGMILVVFGLLIFLNVLISKTP